MIDQIHNLLNVSKAIFLIKLKQIIFRLLLKIKKLFNLSRDIFNFIIKKYLLILKFIFIIIVIFKFY